MDQVDNNPCSYSPYSTLGIVFDSELFVSSRYFMCIHFQEMVARKIFLSLKMNY